MTATKRACAICKAKFWARADALYCSPGCKQRSVRERAKAARAAARLMKTEELELIWPAVAVLEEHGYQRDANRLRRMLWLDQGSVGPSRKDFKGLQFAGPCPI